MNTARTLVLLTLFMVAGTVEAWAQTQADITDVDGLNAMTADGSYIIKADIDASSYSASIENFSGTLEAAAKADGTFYSISGLKKPLFNSINGGTVKNVILSDVSITSGNSAGNAGAICHEAIGASRIYNCGILSGSVGGSGKVGGLVGLLDGTSRVINCYSYANITGGGDKGGIVGYNNKTSTQASLTTMVMNCMFYGDIAEGGNISPIYGGIEINNVKGGFPNYNYYRYNSPYSINGKVNKYNRALAMEEKFITRFERYRLLLNSNRRQAAFFATGSLDNAESKMAKWVLETADRTITNPKPYPILKMQDKYPSIINYDANHAPDSATVGRTHGGKLGKTLTVTISGVGDNAPDDASITTSKLTLQRTDKDFDRFNFNYDKVQLPYYNDVGTGNYTTRTVDTNKESRVVTGWKITDITGGTKGTYSATDKWGGFNFADRNCTNKDLYGTDGSHRVFSQGAYFDVPNGVTAITIEPYWGKAAYVSDQYYDVVYTDGYVANTVTTFGKQHDNDTDIDLYGDGNKQKVYTSVANAVTALNPSSSKLVYDYAVVLVGNVHQDGNPTNGNTPYTVMSIDMNHDNEPDYSYIFAHSGRQAISPIRYDFLNIVGIAEAQMPKTTDTKAKFRNVSIFKPKGWFEITNTCVVHFSQFEYDNGSKSAAPLIFLGGTFNQICSTQKQSPTATQYIHVGSNVWFAKFGNGTHSDGTGSTKHIPVSVTGGDYDEFYLTGTYQPSAAVKTDNAECYVSGGRFGEMAGASLEQINGDIRWQIDWADITSFYGGGVNANKPVLGNLRTDITNSHVGLFCGGPKFGDMSSGKTVVTNAVGCTFDTFFGAGFGGNSYNRVKYYDVENGDPASYQGSYSTDRGNYFDGSTTSANVSNDSYGKKGKGVATDFDYEFFVWSTGSTGARFYVKFLSFSLATTHNVTSTLNGCTVTGNFYGGGSLGKVDGDAVSTLNNCTMQGNVFGAGFSASLPTIDVRKAPAFISDKEPAKNINIGMFEMGEINETEEYQWKHIESMPSNDSPGMESTTSGNYVYTDEDLSALGTVTGNVTLNIEGTTTLAGDVYGGGALASSNTGSPAKLTTVNLKGGTVEGSVFGGAMGDAATAATVGSVEVNLNKDVANTGVKGCVVKGNIFGCNNVNGTPKGSVTVHVYKTQNEAATQIANPAEGDEESMVNKVKGRYDVAAVYGGGNQAAYEPTDLTNGKTQVIIDGCDLTSIEYVYGGGNAASAPATEVTVNGTYEIGNLFAGGNGVGADNPGANVGYRTISYSFTPDSEKTAEENAAAEAAAIAAAKTAATYGAGTAIAYLKGGLVHSAFGGSNTKGNVRVSATVDLNEAMDGEDNPLCDLQIDEVYGAGNQAELDGKSKIDLGCVSYLKELYGGAKNADINNDVELTVKSGRFDRVFGGNNQGGAIRGSIVVNIEETGCHPIVIGELYGGGNQAAYTTPEGKQGPTLNIKSFTSIGDVFGGGLGQSAVVRGNTYVNINEVQGSFADRIGNKVGTIGNVFGGGNAAPVEGSTFVNVGTENNTADITGNVYGGGNNAEVTGNTNVVIGKKTEDATPAPAVSDEP